MQARGFCPTFCAWWPTRHNQEGCAPENVPLNPPGHEVAVMIFESFRLNVKDAERQALRFRRSVAKERRERNPALLFRDIKDEWAAPVETLVEKICREVKEVSLAKGEAILAEEVAWRPGQPFLVHDRPLEVHHSEPDCLYGDFVGVQPGDKIAQHVCLGSLSEVFDAFAAEWTQRWIKLDHLAQGRWDEVFSTFPPAVSSVMPFPPISVDMWRATVRAKSSRSALME